MKKYVKPEVLQNDSIHFETEISATCNCVICAILSRYANFCFPAHGNKKNVHHCGFGHCVKTWKGVPFDQFHPASGPCTLDDIDPNDESQYAAALSDTNH